MEVQSAARSDTPCQLTVRKPLMRRARASGAVATWPTASTGFNRITFCTRNFAIQEKTKRRAAQNVIAMASRIVSGFVS